MPTRVSLAELIDADVSLRPDEAVAIVRDVCRQHADGDLRGIPNAAVIRLTPEGRILVEGPMSRDQDAVPAAAALLSELLPGFQTPTGFKVPGGLRLVLARATRTIDLPPFANVGEFCAALERFAAADPAETARRLFAEWSSRRVPIAAPEPDRELTISDVRRARRATGLSLEDVAQACGIPAAKLRELEWGYVRNWHVNEDSREDLRRYARATGLDEELVLSVAWPLIETADAGPIIDVTPSAPVSENTWALVPVARRDPAPLAWPVRTRDPLVTRHRWLLALAAAIVLVATVIAMGWQRGVPPTTVEARRAEVADERPARPAPDGPVATTGADATETPLENDARHASLVKPLPRAAAPAAARPQRRKAHPAPQQAPRKSFFKRELFRIVFK